MYDHNDIKHIMNNDYSVIGFTENMSDEFNRWFIGLDDDELDKIGYQLSQLHRKFEKDYENCIHSVFSPHFESTLGEEVNYQLSECLKEFEEFYNFSKTKLTNDIFKTFGF